jgi:hypothetical protein
MKIAHSNKEMLGDDDLMSQALEHEEEGEWKEAAAVYEKLLKQTRVNEKLYDRLMIMYRRIKDYKKELSTINHAIEVFETQYSRVHKTPNKKISRISNALMKATGLLNKKGENLYQPGPVGRWKKRKATVQKKIKK